MKKLLCLTMAILVTLSLFAGCGAKPADPAAPANPAAPATPATPEAAKGIGTPEAPVTVTYLCKDVSLAEPGVPEMVKLIEEGMAAQGNYIKLEVLEAPTGKYADVVPIAYRTGQISPDMVYFQGGDLPISQEGLFEDLTPYIEGSTNIKAIMQEHNTAAVANYPYLLWLAPARVQIPVMRKDYFDKLPTAAKVMSDPTPDNYYAMFKEMKDTGLCAIPVTTDGTITKLDSIFNHAFGVTATVIKDGDKWVYSKATKAEKDKLAFYAKLYADGLLDKEYVTKTWETMEQAFYEGTAGLVAGTAGDVINVYNNKMIGTHGPETELVVLPPAKGASQAYQSVDVSKESRGFAINAESQVKDAAWAVLEFMAGPQGRVIDKLGLKDVHYTEADGKYTLTDRFPEWWAKFWPTMSGLDTTKVVGEVLTAPAIQSMDSAQQYFAADVNVLLPEDLLPLMDSMNKLYTEYSTDIIRGVKPVDAFDEFVTKWNAAGGEEIGAYLAETLG